MSLTQNYHQDYDELPFEDVLRKYRYRYLVNLFSKLDAKNILEIGCGYNPIFEHYTNFQKMTIVEVDNHFYEAAIQKADGNSKIKIINKPIQQSAHDLGSDFDLILISGFLHEIDNPEEVITLLKKCCNPNTKVVTFVPNANSFHRVLAYEAEIIEKIYEFSANDKKFGRRLVWDMGSFADMFESNGYQVEQIETYFIKPFAHSQMVKMMEAGIFTNQVLDGLDNMIKYMPDMGCEIALVAKSL
ncbi:MAG TPA: methyltransferase domain-containing protein [Flavobacterium sp.]|uniref:methyltransferase domain-containing protein n=1 Tax=Flavobacterium sp. TaxID=239 RepID=UPI002BD64853|nr:methyltransferase domain-containing protein [Flavobacterium sp.]HNP33338.1 methyltransferase domain-containing protein [Flavobacterium sp.]